jgi:hypothetical protein
MRFPFIIFPSLPSAAFPQATRVKRPLLFFTLQRGDKSINGLAIVDSGADECIFPASWAALLGIAIPNPNTYVFSGTADAPQIAYFENVTMHVWNTGANPGSVAFSFDLYAGFCDTLEHVGMGLLGQNGFFSRYVITINHAENCFDIGA